MIELLRKFKRLNSILKVKRLRKQEVANQLKFLSTERERVMTELARQQDLYLKGVTEINEKRQSPQRTGLEFLEPHVESIKNEWITLYRKKQELDRQIPVVAQNLSHIMKQIEIVEKMCTKNTEDRNLFIEKKSQEELDFLFSVKSQKGRL